MDWLIFSNLNFSVQITTIMKISFTLFLVFFTLFSIKAQKVSVLDAEVEVNGRQLLSPFAGGMNAPQFYKIDLNNDGLEDIFAFDRVGSIATGYLNLGDASFQYDPDIVSGFPQMKEWVVVRDFNKDGIPDIFTYSLTSSSGIRVFLGKWNGDKLEFYQRTWPDQLPIKQDLLHVYNRSTLEKSSNEIYVFNVDIPAFYDVDGDGDIDLLTFEQGGFLLQYYQNRSIELGYGTDSLIFVLEDPCFGKFWESGLTPAMDLSDDRDVCPRPDNFIPDDNENDRSLRHAGSSVSAMDLTGNGLVDLLLGDVSFEFLIGLINGGTVDNAWIISQDTTFPFYDTLVDIRYFPAAFPLDVDSDGREDLIVAPNDFYSLQDTEVGWYYKNIGDGPEAVFSLIQKDFIVGDMIDLGTGTSPTFFDYNGDGLMDMVVGMYDYYTGSESFNSRLVLFENIGTPEIPSFLLVDDDYLGFTEFNGATGAFEFTPHFADMDGDGDMDLIMGEYSGNLYFVENLGGTGNMAQFGPIEYGWQDIRLETSVVPYVHDMDGDGLPDLLIGDRRGEVRFFKNIGSESEPEFIPNVNMQPNIKKLGDLTVRGPGSFLGLSAPTVVYDNGVQKLVVGSDVEQLHIYNVGDQSNLEVPFERSLDEELTQVNTGIRMRPAFADITNDGFLEMVVGNRRGGLNLYKTPYTDNDTVLSADGGQAFDFNWSVSPNPTHNEVQVSIDKNDETLYQTLDLRVYNTLGQVVLTRKFNRDQIMVSLGHLPSGFYTIELSLGGQRSVKKILKR